MIGLAVMGCAGKTKFMELTQFHHNKVSGGKFNP